MNSLEETLETLCMLIAAAVWGYAEKARSWWRGGSRF